MTGSKGGERHAALSAASRRRLLDVLATDGPIDVAALAAAVGLHVTTARFHLDVLGRAGLIRRAAGRTGRPGRPRQLYTLTAAAASGEGYRQLAEALADALAADPDAGPRWAELAGRRWAQMELPTGDGLSWEDGTRRVGELFERVGFAPRLIDDAAERHLELDACPFRDLARAYPQIICRMHLGLLRGSLDRLGVASAERAGLRPFVEPELCVADMLVPPEKEQQRYPEPVL
ncbi:MAG: helix-turn-helix domain-containing protein [Actinomycetota bacterium]|nr:helix-turn-helix domain-containing protein [Actinomycetota bacterium]